MLFCTMMVSPSPGVPIPACVNTLSSLDLLAQCAIYHESGLLSAVPVATDLDVWRSAQEPCLFASSSWILTLPEIPPRCSLSVHQMRIPSRNACLLRFFSGDLVHVIVRMLAPFCHVQHLLFATLRYSGAVVCGRI